MAVTASGLFVPNMISKFNNTQLGLNWVLTTNKVALFTNSITPNFSSDTAYGVAPYNANEASGTGYVAGGAVFAGATVTESPAGTVMFDLNDTAWAAATFGPVRCALAYADALAGKNAICLVNFGGDYSVTSSTFTIQWPATGMWYWDVTP